jgi:preprotein translocase subunit SecG
MQLILTVLHLALAIGLVGLILIQHGRGADAGAAFGSGASGTVFGAQGSGSFLTRTTAILATLFFLTSMALAYFAAQVGEPQGLMDGAELPPPAPAVIDSGDVPMPDIPVAAFDAAGDVPRDVPADLPVPPAAQGAPDASPQGASETLDMPTPGVQSQDASPTVDSGIGDVAAPAATDSDMPPRTD